MKHILRKLIPGLLLLGMVGTPALAQSRVATVNLQRVFDKYWKTEQATAALKDRAADLDKTHQQMLDDLKKVNTQYQKLLEDANNQAVSSDERDKRKKAAEDKYREMMESKDNITQFERQASTSLGEQKARLRKNILDEIKLAIGSKAKAGGYALVIDSGAQTFVPDPAGPYSTPSVLYSNDESDLTDAVVAQLNAGAPVETPKANDNKSDSKKK